jgi:3-hydroxyacyl-[acyl-carrier-protein] dehydratase
MTLALTRPVFAAPIRAVDDLDVTLDAESEVETVVATKQFVATDPYLCGHYPDFTIYPGVFTIETVYQAAREAVEQRFGAHVRAELAGMKSVRFSAPLLPGDTLTATLQIRGSAAEADLFSVKAKCVRADGATAAQVKLDLRVVEEHDNA